MPDYIYLLENRLSADQQNALRQMREAAREAGMILFLTGDAVRDLTSGHAVRDLEVSVHGNALKLKKPIEKLGGSVWGESEASRSLYLCFPGTVRVDVVSTHRLDYTRLDKPVYHPASIQEDLRRRDFTVNAMAISLNEGSFGLLMDPLNGAADIEARTLRLVSNYGFLEEPALLIRATRYIARLGWELDAKSRTRYDNAKGDGVIGNLSPESQSRELEQIGHEDEGLKVLRALEEEGWMSVLFPAWTSAKAEEEKLKALHDLAVELMLQGVRPDMSAAQMQLLTAKMSAKDVAALKKLMLRPGFVDEWNNLDAIAAKFAKTLLSKENSTASAGFKLFTSYDPEAVLWLCFTSKDKAVQERFNEFLKVWPEAKQRIPHALMQEMRITPELATYKQIVQALFLELIDGKLATAEEMRAFLEPHSPPAPPPQITVKRPRAKRGEAKLKERTYDDDEESEDDLGEDEDLDDLGADEEEIDLGLPLPKVELEAEAEDEAEAESVEDEVDADDLEAEGPPVKKTARTPGSGKARSHSHAGKVMADGKQKATPVSAKPSTVPALKVPPASISGKDNNMSKKVVAAAASMTTTSEPGVKPPQGKAMALTARTLSSPGLKPPQATATALTAKTLSSPGLKPPQATATALTAKTVSSPGLKPPQGKAMALTAKTVSSPGLKPPQGKAMALTAKTVSSPGLKPPQGKVKAKAIAAKAVPAKSVSAKGKPASRPAAKPAKKAAPAKAAKVAPKAARKR